MYHDILFPIQSIAEVDVQVTPCWYHSDTSLANTYPFMNRAVYTRWCGVAKRGGCFQWRLLARLQIWRAIIFRQVCLWVCLSVCLCLWPALLPFNIDWFWPNLVTRTLLWSSLAATIMVQIGCRGTARHLFENFKKFSKITEFEFQNSGPFFASVSPVYCKKNFDLIETKLTEEIHFEVCPYGDSGNGTAAAARRSPGLSNWTGAAAACCDQSSGAFGTEGAIGP